MIVDTVKCYFEAAASSPPTYSSIGTPAESSSINNISAGMPGTITSDMALVAIVRAWDLGTTHTCATSGWTKVTQVSNTSGLFLSIWIAQGGAAQPTFFVSGVGAAASAVVVAYSNGNGTSYGAVNTDQGTGTTQTSPSVTSTQDNSLIVLVDAVRAFSGNTGTASGWTKQTQFGGVTGICGLYDKTLATSGSASGAVSLTSPSGEWCQVQFELKHL